MNNYKQATILAGELLLGLLLLLPERVACFDI